MSEKQRLLNILSRFGDDISVESVIYTFLREADKALADLTEYAEKLGVEL